MATTIKERLQEVIMMGYSAKIQCGKLYVRNGQGLNLKGMEELYSAGETAPDTISDPHLVTVYARMKLDLNFDTNANLKHGMEAVAILFHRSATMPLEDIANTGGNAYISAIFEDGTTKQIPHIIRHSPSGFEWGYGGSGPSDAALSILNFLFSPFFADKFYMKFKNEYVSTIPKLGAEITVSCINEALLNG